MTKLNLKQKIIIIIAAVGALLIYIFQHGLYSQPSTEKSPEQAKNIAQSSEEVKLVSTNPTPLEETIVLPTQSVELVFNFPLENIGEFKHRLEPKVDYKAKLSDDKKIVIISPIGSFSPGTEYTLFIQPDSKFIGGKRLKEEIILHFRTIVHKGV
jgi:hypothetical protein